MTLAKPPQALADARRAGQIELATQAHADSLALPHLNHFQQGLFAVQRACSIRTGLTRSDEAATRNSSCGNEP